MPTIIDTHIHSNREWETLIQDLKLRVGYGVSAVMSLSQDPETAPLAIGDEDIPGAARYSSAGRGITSPQPGRTEIPHWSRPKKKRDKLYAKKPSARSRSSSCGSTTATASTKT